MIKLVHCVYEWVLTVKIVLAVCQSHRGSVELQEQVECMCVRDVLVHFFRRAAFLIVLLGPTPLLIPALNIDPLLSPDPPNGSAGGKELLVWELARPTPNPSGCCDNDEVEAENWKVPWVCPDAIWLNIPPPPPPLGSSTEDPKLIFGVEENIVEGAVLPDNVGGVSWCCCWPNLNWGARLVSAEPAPPTGAGVSCCCWPNLNWGAGLASTGPPLPVGVGPNLNGVAELDDPDAPEKLKVAAVVVEIDVRAGDWNMEPVPENSDQIQKS